MKEAFRQWGLPQRFRVDNGFPWGGWNDLPPDLALWLIGYGVEMVWNRPHCPQENAQVERSHGVLKPWSEPETCPDVATLARRLCEAARRQREVYPSVKGASRLRAYPSLTSNPREYSESDWSLDRVCEFLAKGRWRRHADKVGQISLYNRRYSIGRAHGNQDVFVHLDAQTREWFVQDSRGTEIARHPAREITAEAIQSLKVTHRRNSKRSEEPAQTTTS